MIAKTMTSKEIEIGQRFGKWTVTAFAGRLKHSKQHWHVVCECGVEAIVGGPNLLTGGSTRCKACQHNDRIKDEVGNVYGNYTVLHKSSKKGKNGGTRWVCLCKCGTEHEVAGSDLRKGAATQCRTCSKSTHGQAFVGAVSVEYTTWLSMKARCYNPRNKRYANYGGAGIRVCDRWLNSFENFYADMGDRPEGTSIDRIESHMGYSPENCRWATQTQQQNNRTNNHLVVYDNQTMSISEAAERYNINPHTLQRRISKGWDVERALTQPVQSSS